MKRRGRPIMGGISGLIFGLFLAVDLTMYGKHLFNATTGIGLPVIGLVVGVLLGLWAPLRVLRRGRGAGPAASGEGFDQGGSGPSPV